MIHFFSHTARPDAMSSLTLSHFRGSYLCIASSGWWTGKSSSLDLDVHSKVALSFQTHLPDNSQLGLALSPSQRYKGEGI
jgi:hypothetical protein